MASNIRRSTKLRSSETHVKIPPISRLSEAVMAMPKIGNINVCVQMATAYPTKIFVTASTNDIAIDCCIPCHEINQ